MKSELQTIRDYRALLKARMECGCLMSTSSVPCNTHGPRDVADVMLVSCIFMSEHIRHYGVPVRITARNLGELPHNAIPKVTPLPPKAGKITWLSPLPTAPVVEDAGKAFFDAYFKAVSTPSTLPKWEELTAETMEIWRSRAAFLASQNSTKP